MSATAVQEPQADARPVNPAAKTVLFVMGHAGLIRNYEPALRLLDGRGYRIHIAYVDARARKGEMVFVEWLVRACGGISVVQAPGDELAWRSDVWAAAGRLTRLLMDCVRYFDRRFERATLLRDRANSMLAPWLRRLLGVVGIFGDRGVRVALAVLRRVERAIPVSESVMGLLRDVDPDVVLVSPLVDFGSVQTEYVRAAQVLGIPTGCCVASWDNLTNKGHLRVVPDRVFVWNEAQREEAVSFHGIPAENVVVTGAQLFDHWFGWRPARGREEFCRTVGLDPARPFVVFLGSTHWIAPGEMHFVERWIRALRSAADPAVAGVGILLRPHPSQAWRYLSMDFSQVENAAIWPPYTSELIEYFTDEGKNEFFESLFYAAAAVGVNTSAMIEAGIVGCPTCTVSDSATAQGQEGTLHFDLLTDTGGGLLRIADGLEAHTADLSEVFASGRNGDSRQFIEAFVRPHGLDVPAGPILADAIETTVQLQPDPLPANTLTDKALRPPIYLTTKLMLGAGPFATKEKGPRSMPLARWLGRMWARGLARVYSAARLADRLR